MHTNTRITTSSFSRSLIPSLPLSFLLTQSSARVQSLSPFCSFSLLFLSLSCSFSLLLLHASPKLVVLPFFYLLSPSSARSFSLNFAVALAVSLAVPLAVPLAVSLADSLTLAHSHAHAHALCLLAQFQLACGVRSCLHIHTRVPRLRARMLSPTHSFALFFARVLSL